MTDDVARRAVKRYAESSSLPTDYTALAEDLSEDEILGFPGTDEYLWRSRNDKGDLVLIGLKEIRYQTDDHEDVIPWGQYEKVSSPHASGGDLNRPKHLFEELVVDECSGKKHSLRTQSGSDHFVLFGLLVRLETIARRNRQSAQEK